MLNRKNMRELTTIIEVDERGRMLMPLALRKALGIENKKAIIHMTVSLVKDETQDPLKALSSPAVASPA